MNPHDREYLAAAAHLSDQTISQPVTVMRDGAPLDTYAVGNRIRFLEDGRELAGVVVAVIDHRTYRVRRHVPDHGNVTYIVDIEQVPAF